MHVHDMQLARVDGLLEPFAVGVVEAEGEALVVGLVVGLADGDGLGVALHVGDVDVLDERVVVHEGFKQRGERGGIGGLLALVGEAFHQMGGQFPGDALHLVEFAVEEFRHEAADEVLDFLVGEGGVAAFLVGVHDLGVNLAHGGMLLGNLPFRGQVELLVDPVGHARAPGLVVDDARHAAVEDFGRIEDVVDFFVLGEAIHVDARAGGVEVLARKGVVVGDTVVEFLLEVLGDFRNHRGIGGLVVAGEGNVVDDQRLKRGVARALPEAHQRAVDAAAAVEPCGYTVDEHLVEVVVAAPSQPRAGDARIVGEGAHDALHRTRKRRAGEGHAVTHRIAEADFDGHGGFLREFHELARERQAEAVDVGAGHVLEVAARHDAPFERLGDDLEVVVHGLFARFTELEEDMVVGHAGEQAHFVEFHVMGDFEVVHIGAYPARDPREAVAAGPAHFDGFPVFRRIHEEFGRLNQAAFAAELVQQIEDARDLFDRVGRAGLLAVAEGGVRDEHGLGRAGDEEGVVEFDAADMRIRENVPVQFGLGRIVERQGAGSVFGIQQAHDAGPPEDKVLSVGKRECFS